MYYYYMNKLAVKLPDCEFKDPKKKKYPKHQLEIGKEIEKEHTDNEEVSELIAKIHIDESDKYYDPNLLAMEKKMDKDKEKEKSALMVSLDSILKEAEATKKDPVEEFAKRNSKKKLEDADMSQWEFQPPEYMDVNQFRQYPSLENSQSLASLKAYLKKSDPPPPPPPDE